MLCLSSLSLHSDWNPSPGSDLGNPTSHHLCFLSQGSLPFIAWYPLSWALIFPLLCTIFTCLSRRVDQSLLSYVNQKHTSSPRTGFQGLSPVLQSEESLYPHDADNPISKDWFKYPNCGSICFYCQLQWKERKTISSNHKANGYQSSPQNMCFHCTLFWGLYKLVQTLTLISI